MLPFGLHSAPKIFNAVANGLEWYLRSRGIRHIAHCLDDFIVIGPPRSSECADALATLDDVCSRLGIPLAQYKRDGPTTSLTFLGVEVDTEAAELHLLKDKLERLRSLLEDCAACWTSSKGITTPMPPSNQAEQVVLLRSDLVEAVCC